MLTLNLFYCNIKYTEVKILNIGQRIRQKRESLGLSQEELAQKLGYKSRSTINKIESGINDITQSKVVKFAQALQTTPAALMGWEDEKETGIPSYENIMPIKTHKIPLLGEIACGVPIYANEDRESYVEIGTAIQADFCLRAKGDSMINARILDGDIVFIRKQSTVDDGEIAAVVINDDATLKRVYYNHKSGILQLVSENPRFAPLVYSGEQLNSVHILGKAIAFQSDVK